VLRDMGVVDSRRLAGHDTSPTTSTGTQRRADLVRRRDGLFYYMRIQTR